MINQTHVKTDQDLWFRCCGERPDLYDIISSTEHSEFVIKKCANCNTKYNEEVINGKPAAGYPVITTWKREENNVG